MNTLHGVAKLMATSIRHLDMLLASGGIENARSSLQEAERKRQLLAATAIMVAPAAPMDRTA